MFFAIDFSEVSFMFPSADNITRLEIYFLLPTRIVSLQELENV